MNSALPTLLSALALILTLTISSSPALAQDALKDAKALHDSGLKAYKSGHFMKAGEDFMAAHAIDPSASLLWNAARSFGKSGDTARAREAYTTYIQHKDAKEEKVNRAERWLVNHPERAPAHTPEAQHSAPSAPQGVPKNTPPLRSEESSRWAGWTLVSLASAGVVGASVAMILAQSARDESAALLWDEDYVATFARHQDIAETTETRELAAWATYGVSAGLMAVGLLLLLRDSDSKGGHRARSFKVLPTQDGLEIKAAWHF